jgi:hypothetical protein
MLDPVAFGDGPEAFAGLDPFDGFGLLMVGELKFAAELGATLDGGSTALVRTLGAKVPRKFSRTTIGLSLPCPWRLKRARPCATPLCPRGGLVRFVALAGKTRAIEGQAGTHHLLTYVLFPEEAAHGRAAARRLRLHASATHVTLASHQLPELEARGFTTCPHLSIAPAAGLIGLESVDAVQPDVKVSDHKVIAILFGSSGPAKLLLGKTWLAQDQTSRDQHQRRDISKSRRTVHHPNPHFVCGPACAAAGR